MTGNSKLPNETSVLKNNFDSDDSDDDDDFKLSKVDDEDDDDDDGLGLKSLLEEWFGDEALMKASEARTRLKSHLETLKKFIDSNSDKLHLSTSADPSDLEDCICVPTTEPASYVVITLLKKDSDDQCSPSLPSFKQLLEVLDTVDPKSVLFQIEL